MLAIQLVEFAIVGGVVFRAVPPVPVTALGDENFFPSQLLLLRGTAGRIFGVEVAGMVEVVPGTVVLGGSDPDVVVSVDPRAGNNFTEDVKFFVTCDRFRDGHGFDFGIALEGIVKAAQEFTA